MRQLTFLSTFLFLLVSCQTNSSSSIKAAQTSGLDSSKTIKSIINGNWYQASYIDSIQKTKSPFHSQNALAEYVEFDINANEASGDSLVVWAPGIHEGTSFTVYFRPGLTSTSLPTNILDYDTTGNFYELGYNISGSDTSLILSTYSKGKKLLNKTKYLKAPKNSEGTLQYMVNKTLFAGSYKAQDSSGSISLLKFTNDGRIEGLPNYKKYYVLTDFVAEPEKSVDEVCLDIQTSNQKCYGFIINADTIKLYDVKESEDSSQFGELKFKLVKQ
jgi:hypothetical protein